MTVPLPIATTTSTTNTLPNPPNHPHVLIIGAGSTGLLIAQGLLRQNVSFTIYERTTHDTYAHRSRDWSMGLHWGSTHLQQILPPSLFARLATDASTDANVPLTAEQERYSPVLNGRTGAVELRVDAGSTRRVSRRRLREVLSEGLEIRYGKEIVGIEVLGDGEGVVARFADGSMDTGSLLVGCDSASSFVRSWLVGSEVGKLTELPITPYNFTVSFPADKARWLRDHTHPLIKAAVHPDMPTWHFIATLDARDKADPASWVFQIFMHEWTDGSVQRDEFLSKYARSSNTTQASSSAEMTSAQRLAHYKHLASSYCEPFRSAAAWIDDAVVWVPHDRISHWYPPVRWPSHGGRVTLAGDAAHAMAPHRAQGLNNALLDAVVFLDTVREMFPERVAAGGEVGEGEMGDGNVVGGGVAEGDVKGGVGEKERVRREELLDRYADEVFERGRAETERSAMQAFDTMHFEKYRVSTVAKVGYAVPESSESSSPLSSSSS